MMNTVIKQLSYKYIKV